MRLLWAYGCGLLALTHLVFGSVDPFGCKSCEEEVALESFTGCFNVIGVSKCRGNNQGYPIATNQLSDIGSTYERLLIPMFTYPIHA
jgi:hypothetical protein